MKEKWEIEIYFRLLGAGELTFLEGSCGGRWVQGSSRGALCTAGSPVHRSSSVTRRHAADRTRATVGWTPMTLWYLRRDQEESLKAF